MSKSRGHSIEQICQHCKQAFQACAHDVKRGRARFCTLKCWYASDAFASVRTGGGGAGRPKRPLLERFWENIVKKDGCWEWIGHLTEKGYGSIGGKRKFRIKAHRLSWEIHFGIIPEGLVVCHKCDNPPCCNPDHLFLGTLKDNAMDMASKGRGARQKARIARETARATEIAESPSLQG